MNHFDFDMHRALSELDDPRRGIALKRNTAIDLVTALIDFLDQTEADPDLEPSLGSPEITADVSRVGIGWWSEIGDQTAWAQGLGAMEEETAEAEDAGGGDVLQEPHDEEPDYEWSLGWGFGIKQQTHVATAIFNFTGDLEASGDLVEGDRS